MRYIYCLSTDAIVTDVSANLSLVPDVIGSSVAREVFLEFAAPLNAYDKAILDDEMLNKGYIFHHQEDDANPPMVQLLNRTIAASPMTDLFNGISYTEFWPCNYKINDIFASLALAASAEVDIDILVNTVSIFTTTLTIDAGDNTNLTATTPYAIAAGSEFITQSDRVDINIISNGGDGEGLILTLNGEQLA